MGQYESELSKMWQLALLSVTTPADDTWWTHGPPTRGRPMLFVSCPPCRWISPPHRQGARGGKTMAMGHDRHADGLHSKPRAPTPLWAGALETPHGECVGKAPPHGQP